MTLISQEYMKQHMEDYTHPDNTNNLMEDNIMNGLNAITPVDSANLALKKFVEDDYPMIHDTTELLTVNNPETFAAAGDWRKKVTDAIKAIETRRKAIVDPINKELKDVNAAFKMVSTLFDGLLTQLDGKMKPFAIQQQQAREAAAELARQEELKKREALQAVVEKTATETGNETLLEMAIGIEDNKNKFAEKELKVTKTTHGEEASTSLKKRWYYRVTDETKVCKELLSVDDKKVKAFMAANDADLKVGKLTALGIEFYCDYDLSSRGK
jgi:hypothetical protein